MKGRALRPVSRSAARSWTCLTISSWPGYSARTSNRTLRRAIAHPRLDLQGGARLLRPTRVLDGFAGFDGGDPEDEMTEVGWRGVGWGTAAHINESNYAYQMHIRAPILAQMTLTLYGQTSAKWSNNPVKSSSMSHEYVIIFITRWKRQTRLKSRPAQRAMRRPDRTLPR